MTIQLGDGAGPGTFAAPHLAGDHRRADGVLGPPAGRLDPGGGKEGEQVLALPTQVVRQSAVGRVDGGAGHQLVDRLGAAVDLGGQVLGGKLASVAGSPQPKRLSEDAADRVRGLGLPPIGIGDELTAAPQQVRQARLMGRVGELAVRRPAVTLDDPGELLAEQRPTISM